MSFTVDMHFCGDRLVETTIFQKAKGCGMEMEKPSAEGCTISKNNCCSDVQQIIDGQDEMQFTIDKLTIDPQIFIVSFVYTYKNLFEATEKKDTSIRDYFPPPVTREIYKLDETYLI
jgi:hypothetical protein